MWTFTKKRKIQKIKETEDSRYIYQNKIDKAPFQHGMAHGGSKDLLKRTVSDKVLHDKAFNIARKTKFDGYQRGLLY